MGIIVAICYLVAVLDIHDRSFYAFAQSMNPPTSDNSKFSNSSNIENILQNRENLICSESALVGQSTEEEGCYAIANVLYESNSTVILTAPNASNTGAAIDLIKTHGYVVNSFAPPNPQTNSYTVLMSK